MVEFNAIPTKVCLGLTVRHNLWGSGPDRCMLYVVGPKANIIHHLPTVPNRNLQYVTEPPSGAVFVQHFTRCQVGAHQACPYRDPPCLASSFSLPPPLPLHLAAQGRQAWALAWGCPVSQTLGRCQGAC